MSENTVKHEHKQCGGKNIEKMEEIGKTMPVEERYMTWQSFSKSLATKQE